MNSARPDGVVRKEDVAVAKNFLTEEELHALNRIVNAYLEFAELQALNRRAMTMSDWIRKLDDFLKLSERDLLTHSGLVSAESARIKAEREFEQYRQLTDALPRPVDADFERYVKQIQGAANPTTAAKPARSKRPTKKP